MIPPMSLDLQTSGLPGIPADSPMHAKSMDLLTFTMDNRLKYGSPIKIVIAILPAIPEEDCKLPESSGSAGISAAGVQY